MASGTSGKILALVATVVGALITLRAGAAEGLRRCEDASGHVTYSNETCPSGTARERAVENRPAVEVPRESGGEKTPASARGGAIVPSGAPVESRNPETLKELDQDQRKALVSKCDDLVRRIEYGQQDLLSAGSSERASVELGLRRLQQEHETLCAPPKPRP